MRNGIIFGTAMVEKKIEDGKVRCSAAYPTGREFGKEPYHIDRITGVCPSGTVMKNNRKVCVWLARISPDAVARAAKCALGGVQECRKIFADESLTSVS